MRSNISVVAIITVLLASITSMVCAEPMDVTGKYDIGELMILAEQTYDLSKMDAVLLLESESVNVERDGRTSTTIHRIAWFNSELGSELYADLRVPYNSDNQTLTVTALRTWRDGTWWPHESELNPTAVVETTPYGLASADDYLTILETMLLHDGVELPCVVETQYQVMENTPGPGGADGLWMFPKADPAVKTVFEIVTPRGTGKYFVGNGTPKPETVNDGGMTTYVWRMDLVDRLSRPLIDDPLIYAPYVVWSTWENWEALTESYSGIFKSAMVLNETITDTLAERMKREPNLFAKAQAVAHYVDETTRSIGYDDSHWMFSPRTAERTWETAYGHRTDRAIFAAALFAEVGCGVEPIFVTPSPREVDPKVPSLSWFEDLSLVISGKDLWTLYDPSSGTMMHADQSYIGRTYWLPGMESMPQVYQDDNGGPGKFEVIVTLEADEEEWSGTGFFRASGSLCPHGEMIGLSGESSGHIGDIAGGVLPGADVTDYNFIEFSRASVVGGFDFDFEPDEPDDQDRTRIEIGDPAGGIMDNMPSGVHAYSQHRDSPVVMTAPMSQKITFRLKTDDQDIFHLPSETSVTNEIGSFSLSVMEDEDWVIVTRELALNTDNVTPGQWPHLRQLLLEEQDAGRRIVMLKDEE